MELHTFGSKWKKGFIFWDQLEAHQETLPEEPWGCGPFFGKPRCSEQVIAVTSCAAN